MQTTKLSMLKGCFLYTIRILVVMENFEIPGKKCKINHFYTQFKKRIVYQRTLMQTIK